MGVVPPHAPAASNTEKTIAGKRMKYAMVLVIGFQAFDAAT